MSDEREFNLESPRSQRMSPRKRPKMGKVTSKDKGPQLHSQRKGKRPRSTYVERDEEQVEKKTLLVAGFGSKLQMILFLFVMAVYAYFFVPLILEFLSKSK